MLRRNLLEQLWRNLVLKLCIGFYLELRRVELHAGNLQRRTVRFGLGLRDVLSWLLLERRHRHVVLVLLGGNLLWLRRVRLHELRVGLHVRLRLLKLYAGHVQCGPVPLGLELLRLLARLRVIGWYGNIVQHLLRQHVCGLGCGLLLELPDRDELQQWRRELLRNPVRGWSAARRQHLHNVRRRLVLARRVLIVLHVPGEHVLGQRRGVVHELRVRLRLEPRRVELHSGDPDAFRDADADAVDYADGEPHGKPDTELDAVDDVNYEPDVDIDREYHGDAVDDTVAERDSVRNG